MKLQHYALAGLASSIALPLFMPDFSKLLDVPIGDIKEPVPKPEGTYRGIIEKHTVEESRTKEKTPVVKFSVKLHEAMSDVDQDELTVALNGQALSELPAMIHDMWLTPDAMYRIVELIKSLGINYEPQNSLGSYLPETWNKEVMVSIIKVPAKKNGNVVEGKFYSNIDKLVGTAAA